MPVFMSKNIFSNFLINILFKKKQIEEIIIYSLDKYLMIINNI